MVNTPEPSDTISPSHATEVAKDMTKLCTRVKTFAEIVPIDPHYNAAGEALQALEAMANEFLTTLDGATEAPTIAYVTAVCQGGRSVVFQICITYTQPL